MRIQVNLATRPFVELRPFFALLRLVMAALVLVGLGLAIWTHALQKKLDRAQGQMNDLRTQTDSFQREKLHNEQRMRQPINAEVLDRAHFLNGLFLRKSFSWTAVMMDLENVLPTGVQVTSIEPQVTADGNVIIRMRVAGERDRAVQLVRNLERSQRFRAPRLTGESVQAKEAGQSNGSGMVNRALQAGGASPLPGGVEFEILADYNALPEGQPYTRRKVSSDTDGGSATGHRSRRGSGGLPTASSQPPSALAGAYPRYGVVLKPRDGAASPAQAAGRSGSQGAPR